MHIYFLFYWELIITPKVCQRLQQIESCSSENLTYKPENLIHGEMS